MFDRDSMSCNAAEMNHPIIPLGRLQSNRYEDFTNMYANIF